MRLNNSLRIGYIGHGLEVKLSLIPNAGNGLFATVPFAKGALITEYDGYYVSKDAAKELAERNPEAASHFRGVPTGDVIAGFKLPKEADGWGGASFANDRRDSSNNSKLEDIWQGPVCRVFLVATEDIAAGDEICTSYGSTYWKRV